MIRHGTISFARVLLRVLRRGAFWYSLCLGGFALAADVDSVLLGGSASGDGSSDSNEIVILLQGISDSMPSLEQQQNLYNLLNSALFGAGSGLPPSDRMSAIVNYLQSIASSVSGYTPFTFDYDALEWLNQESTQLDILDTLNSDLPELLYTIRLLYSAFNQITPDMLGALHQLQEGMDSSSSNQLDRLDSLLSAFESQSASVSNQVSSLQSVSNTLEQVASTNGIRIDWASVPVLNVNITNQFSCDYDDRWLKWFLTGREDGDNNGAPRFLTAGTTPQPPQTSAGQSLQTFLSLTLGQLYWANNTTDWGQAFTMGRNSYNGNGMGNRPQLFTVWLAEALRRNLATNQAILSVLQNANWGVEPWDILTNRQEYYYSYPARTYDESTVQFLSRVIGQFYDDGDSGFFPDHDRLFLSGDRRLWTRWLAEELRRLDSNQTNLLALLYDPNGFSASSSPDSSNSFFRVVLEVLSSSERESSYVSTSVSNFVQSSEQFAESTNSPPVDDPGFLGSTGLESPFLDFSDSFSSLDYTNSFLFPGITNFSDLPLDEFFLRRGDFPDIESLESDFSDVRASVERAAAKLQSEAQKLAALQSVFAASPILRLRVRGALNPFASLAGHSGDLPASDVVIDFSEHLNVSVLDSVGRWFWQFVQFFACLWIALKFLQKILARI